LKPEAEGSRLKETDAITFASSFALRIRQLHVSIYNSRQSSDFETVSQTLLLRCLAIHR
jgi:hypothetical protein